MTMPRLRLAHYIQMKSIFAMPRLGNIVGVFVVTASVMMLKNLTVTRIFAQVPSPNASFFVMSITNMTLPRILTNSAPLNAIDTEVVSSYSSSDQ